MELKDLETVESRATKIKKAAGTGDKDAKKAFAFYEKIIHAEIMTTKWEIMSLSSTKISNENSTENIVHSA